MTGYEAMHNILNEYLNFEVEGKRVKIPYILQYSLANYSRTSGKGSPTMLRDELYQDARKRNFNLKTASANEIYAFMKMHRIGVECSGFVYRLLDTYLKAKTGQELYEHIRLFPGIIGDIEHWLRKGRRFRNTNAKMLTSELNTVQVNRLNDVKVADLIRMSVKKNADHVLIVVDVKRNKDGTVKEIVYAHSSSVNTRKRGPHKGTIEVTSPESGLEDQVWHEVTKTGDSYGKFFRPETGDSIRRLKVLANAVGM